MQFWVTCWMALCTLGPIIDIFESTVRWHLSHNWYYYECAAARCRGVPQESKQLCVTVSARCDPSEAPLFLALFVLFWIHWLVFWPVNLWEKWYSCLRGYCFRLGVPAYSFNGIHIGRMFLAFPGVPLAHISGLTFSQTQGGGEKGKSSPFLGFLQVPSVGLKRVLREAVGGGDLISSCSGEKLQGEVYQKVNQLIPHCQFYLGLWGNWN